MNKKVNFLNVICCALFMMIIFTIGDNIASAKTPNTTDIAWGYNLSVQNSSYRFTQNIEKVNDTSVYVKWSDKTGTLSALNLKVYGDGRDCGTNKIGTSHTYYVPGLGQYSVINYVNENGCKMCSVGFRANSGYGVAQGLWSPDSAGSYTKIY